jgi:hypothetical protein
LQSCDWRLNPVDNALSRRLCHAPWPFQLRRVGAEGVTHLSTRPLVQPQRRASPPKRRRPVLASPQLAAPSLSASAADVTAWTYFCESRVGLTAGLQVELMAGLAFVLVSFELSASAWQRAVRESAAIAGVVNSQTSPEIAALTRATLADRVASLGDVCLRLRSSFLCACEKSYCRTT